MIRRLPACCFSLSTTRACLPPRAAFDKPVVLLNGDDPFMRLSSVTPCNRSSARLAADHLIDLGHERILFLMRPGRRTIERRYEGWKDALLHRGLPFDKGLMVPVEDWLAGACRPGSRGTHRCPRARFHRRAGRWRQPGRRCDDGCPAVRIYCARRRFGDGHGRSSAGGLPQSAADDHAYPNARDRLGGARSAARQPLQPAHAAASRGTCLPSR